MVDVAKNGLSVGIILPYSCPRMTVQFSAHTQVTASPFFLTQSASVEVTDTAMQSTHAESVTSDIEMGLCV